MWKGKMYKVFGVFFLVRYGDYNKGDGRRVEKFRLMRNMFLYY